MTTRYVRLSELKAFKRCRRKWSLAYWRGLESKNEKVGAHTTGTFVHSALESYYSGGPAVVISDPDKYLNDEDYRKHVEMAEIMVEGYIDWLAETGADAGIEVVAVEEQIEVPFGNVLGDDIVLTGRMDLRITDALGRKMFLDHKTVTSLDQAGRQLQVDDQLLTYAMLLRMHTGEFIDGATYNMLRKVKRTARSNPPFYGRVEVHFGVEQLRSHYSHVQATLVDLVSAAQGMERSESYHRWAYPNPTKDCDWDCPFMAVCVMHDDGSDLEGVLGEFYKPKGGSE